MATSAELLAAALQTKTLIQAADAKNDEIIAELLPASDTVAPVMQGGLTAGAITATGYELAWPPAIDNVAVVGYELSLDAGATWIDVGLYVSAPVSGRVPGSVDSVQVRARDAANNRSLPLSLQVQLQQPPDTIAPTMDGGITVSQVTATSYRADWPMAVDNVAVAAYEFNIGAGWTNTGLLRGVDITGRTPGSTDTLQARAVDVAGNASAPLSVTVTLQAESPPPTSDIAWTKISSIETAQALLPRATPQGQTGQLFLPGGGYSDMTPSEKAGDWWEGVCTGPQFFDAYNSDSFAGFAGRRTDSVSGVTLNHYDTHFRPNGTKIYSYWAGFTNGPGSVLDLVTVRRVRRLLQQFPTLYPQVDPMRIGISGNSMGAWGVAGLIRYIHDLVAYAAMNMPRWRYAGTAGPHYEAIDLAVRDIAPNIKRLYGDGLQLSPMDGGGPADMRHFDVLAYLANPANPAPPLFWVISTEDGYGPWSDQVAAIQIMRATERPFACAWKPGTHGQGPNMQEVFNTYGPTEFRLNRGMPLFTNSSRDADPLTAPAGGINQGFSFQGVAESPNTWSCYIRNNQTTTVTVKPWSKVFNPGKLPVEPQVHTLAPNIWKQVAFAV